MRTLVENRDTLTAVAVGEDDVSEAEKVVEDEDDEMVELVAVRNGVTVISTEVGGGILRRCISHSVGVKGWFDEVR